MEKLRSTVSIKLSLVITEIIVFYNLIIRVQILSDVSNQITKWLITNLMEL